MIKRKFLNLGIFVIFSFIIECTAFAFIGFPFITPYFYLELFLFITAGSLIFIFNNTLIDRIYLPILLFITTFLLIVNDLYYLATGNIFSISNLNIAKQFNWNVVMQYFKPNIVSILLVLMLVAYFLILFINIKFKVKKLSKKQRFKKLVKFGLIGLVSSITLYSGATVGATVFDEKVKRNQFGSNVSFASNYNFSRYGMFTFYIKEIYSMIAKEKISDKELNEYFTSVKYKTDKYTGTCKDMNVITIMIETGAVDMINETLTPNLYYYLSNGINFTNNYQKNPTGVSEFVGFLGNYPACNQYVTNINASVPFSLPYILSNQNYETIYCHDVNEQVDLYNRLKLIPKLGFKHQCFHEDLYKDGTPIWGWGDFTFDSDNTEHLIDYIEEYKNQKFYLHYTTLNMHFPYSYNDNDQYYVKLKTKYQSKLDQAKSEGKYINKLEGTKYNNQAKYFDTYMMKSMDFDEGLEKLRNFLITNDLENNTLVILYGDHDIYGTGTNNIQFSKMLKNVDDNYDIRLYDTVMSIYNPALNQKYKVLNSGSNEYNKFTSANIIVPTILDLLEIKYCPNMYFGKSVFIDDYDENYPMFSYNLCSYLNKHYLSKIGYEIDKIYDDDNSKKIFLDYCREFNSKRIYINYIYNNNYFKNHNYDNLIVE